jgi:DNA-binding CsgD family transcriptional regulator
VILPAGIFKATYYIFKLIHFPCLSHLRSAPGILLVDHGGNFVHANEQALDFLATLRAAGQDSSTVTEQVRALCCQIRKGGADTLTIQPMAGREPGLAAPYLMRAFPLSPVGGGDPATHTLVLVEPLVEQRQIDLKEIQRSGHLSKREAEVLNLLRLGNSNRTIAEALFISELTVKDHVKVIMKKLGAGSRCEIVASLK